MGDVLHYGKAGPRWGPRRVLIWCGAVAVAMIVAIISWRQFPTVRGHMTGRAEADRQWAAGKATIYITGDNLLGLDLDRTTGLRREHIAYCVVNDEIHARQSSHNNRIAELIASHGPPAYSWLIREPGVLAPGGTWKARVASGETPQRVGDSPIIVICGTSRHAYRVRIPAGTEDLEVDGVTINWPYVPREGLLVLGSLRDEKVFYFSGPVIGGLTAYIAQELGGSWSQIDLDLKP